jgi:hypothetical protein
MPTGLYDVRDKAEVLHPQEIAAGKAQCVVDNVDYIPNADGTVTPLSLFVDRLTARWTRACETARLIDYMREGYCTIMPNDAAPGSDARH